MSLHIMYDQKSCIGAGECEALAKDLWKVNNEGLAELKGATINEETGFYELEVNETTENFHRKITGSCPVGCIKLEKR